MQLRTAERRKAKVRIGLFGPSGSGKTYSALLLARGLTDKWEKIAVIDTENKSADLYSHLGPYIVGDIDAPYQPEKYMEAIKDCERAGAEVIIIDSITHEWSGTGGILEDADRLGASAKNSFTVWGKLTPRHNKFIEAILQSSAHIICCGRSKQEYVMNQVEKNGKTVNIPEKVGLKAITREGFDYEMTLSFDLAISHFAYSSKDRTSMFADKPEHIISQKTGEQIKEWNDGGKIDYDQMRKDIISELTRINRAPTSKEFVAAKGKDIEKMIKEATKLKLEEKNFDNILAKLKTIPAIEPEVSASSEEIPVVEGRAIETEEVETDKTEEEIDEELQEKMNRAKNKKEIKAKPVCQK